MRPPRPGWIYASNTELFASHALLTVSLILMAKKGAELGEVARQLRILSGLYDQAARSATNL